MTRPLGFFLETKVERKWCTNNIMHRRGWGLGTRLQNADTCVSREPKYRGLDGEAAECRLCKHCGCMLNTDYIWLHKSSSSEKIDPHADQKQEINFVWPNHGLMPNLVMQCILQRMQEIPLTANSCTHYMTAHPPWRLALVPWSVLELL